MDENHTKDNYFRVYTQALAVRHALMVLGKEEDHEVEQAETRMAIVWPNLNEAQKKEASGIGSDLNWLERGYAHASKARRQEDVTKEELDEYDKLLVASNTDKDKVLPLLHALRACAAGLAIEAIAIVRAKCYSELGLDEIAEPYLNSSHL